MKRLHINHKILRYVFCLCFLSLALNANASTYYGSYSGKYGDGFGYTVNVWKESSGTNQYKFEGSSWKEKESYSDSLNHNTYLDSFLGKFSSGWNWSSYDIACFVNDDRKHHGTSYDHNYGVVPLPAAAPLFVTALALVGFITHRRRKS